MNEELFTAVYNPDVLSCIANLSNDEVFTPPGIANDVLDMLPQELFQSRDTTFLDPASKSGIFLREIAKRLLRAQVPGYEQTAREIQQKQRKGEPLDQDDESFLVVLQENIDHIFHKQLFGIATTEITSLLSRRSAYCSKFPNSEFSISHFDSVEGNIRFRRVSHSWDKNGSCSYCGASQKVYDRGDKLETYAYEFIHAKRPEDIFSMKFDVIISNPPYQLNVGVEKENYAIPIYHKFVDRAKKLNPRYIAMIIPARWYAGGRGLDDFRKSMLEDDRIRVIHDYPKSMDCFPGVEIQGGVCYFLWDRDNRGQCSIYTHIKNEISGPMMRPLLEKDCSTFIRYNQSVPIFRKVQQKREESFSSLVSPQTPFGLVTSYKGSPVKQSPSDIKMYISGNEKQYKGGSSFVPDSKVLKGREMIPWHKVYIGEAYGGGMDFPHSILTKPFYGEPNTVCNQSYLVIGPFKSQNECQNVMSYIATKFFRFMVLQKKNAQHAMRGVYQFVPMQDFSKPWTDKELYAKYGLTDEEIAFIETMIKPMDLSAEDASEDA